MQKYFTQCLDINSKSCIFATVQKHLRNHLNIKVMETIWKPIEITPKLAWYNSCKGLPNWTFETTDNRGKVIWVTLIKRSDKSYTLITGGVHHNIDASHKKYAPQLVFNLAKLFLGEVQANKFLQIINQ